MKWLNVALEYLFGCHHHNLSRVFTIGGQTYCVCVDCGREFDYSLAQMSVVTPHAKGVALKTRVAC